MRIDLTPDFLLAMVQDHRAPIQLMVVHFEAGDVYLSDRDLTIDGQLYQGLIEDWGTLSSVGEERSESGTQELTVTIWNGGNNPFSNFFFIEDPVNVFVDVYQTFDGLAASDIAHVGEFVMQDPLEFSESSALLSIELISTNMRYFGQVGSLLLKKDYPNALEADLNKSIDLIIGEPGRVKCLTADKPPVATLDGSVLKSTTFFYVRENPIEEGFSTIGFLQIGEEIARYDFRNENYFRVVQRGYDKTVSQTHGDGSNVIQALRDVVYIVGQGPLLSINDVLVGGQVPAVPFSISPATNPATITFETQPTFTELINTVEDSAYFDATGAANTALQPHYSYWKEYASEGARINKSYRTLSVIQEDVIGDFGEILNIFLSVTHWSTAPYLNDYVKAIIIDAGGNIEVGRLSRPNEQDTIEVSGTIDIDHPHDHEIGGDHDHNFDDPVNNYDSPVHGHEVDTTISVVASNDQDFKTSNTIYYSTRDTYTKMEVRFNVGDLPTNASSCKIRFSIINGGQGGNYVNSIEAHSTYKSGVYIGNTPGSQLGTDQYEIDGGSWAGAYSNGYLNVRIYAKVVAANGSYNFTIANVSYEARTVRPPTTADTAEVRENALIAGTPGNVDFQGIDTTALKIKDKGDVEKLATANRPLTDVESSKTTKSYTELFDITDHLENVDWTWFLNREAQLIFTGSASGQTVYITNIEMVVEYRQREVNPTDEITCIPVGSIESRPDAVIQYLLTEKAGVPLSKLSSVWRNVSIWDDLDIWDDTELWLDQGQVSGVPAGAAFEEAAAWYSYANYFIDGVISGALTVKDAIRDVTWQSRSKLIWQNGKVQLTIQRESDTWNAERELLTDDIQLQSFSAKRSNVDEIINRIEIFHTLDRLSEATGREMYDATANREDLTSISKHGERVQDEKWLFYLVRRQAMADDVADYYLWLLGETTTYYSLSAYLNSFELEKEDYIKVNSVRWQAISSLPVVIRELVREFGSGKISKINILRLVAQSIRHKFFTVFENDEIILNDALVINFGSEQFENDIVAITDFLLATWNIDEDETINLSDAFAIFWQAYQNPTETIQLGSALGVHIGVDLQSQMSLSDDILINQELCFGACGFGGGEFCQIPFGSRTIHTGRPTENLYFNETLVMNIQPGLETDCIATDNLIFSDGFGCPSGLGEGMGLSPFGC